MNDYLSLINDSGLRPAARLEALRSWEAERQKTLTETSEEINNHIHTIYSFSPYTPSMAALRAKSAGLRAAGSVDHDSIAAADEMLAACAILGIGGCVGFELRASFKKGPFAGRKLNNPDSQGNAYITVQGIPGPAIPKAAEFLAPIREQRLRRTREMTVTANVALKEAGLEEIDFERDIVSASQYAAGGGITERHLLAAFANKFIGKYGKGSGVTGGLKAKLGIITPPKIAALLSDPDNPHYLYDLLGVLKSGFLPRVYIQPDENECISANRVTAFAESIRAVSAYAYLGDVGESPTGDKKAEKFEDDYIEELFQELRCLGFRAITYMPPRNTLTQLHNLRRLSAKWGFMEISGVDINSSRQSFNCPDLLRDEFRHLLDSNWALIAHERLASIDTRLGLFSRDNPLADMEIPRRLALYAEAGRKLDLRHPDDSAVEVMRHLIQKI